MPYFPPPSSGSGTPPSDEDYSPTTWDAVTTVAPTKNVVRDQIEKINAFYVAIGGYI